MISDTPLWEAPLTLSQHLGRVEGKVDALILMQQDTGKRLGDVEKQVWWGRGAVVVAIFAFIPKLRDLAAAIGLG